MRTEKFSVLPWIPLAIVTSLTRVRLVRKLLTWQRKLALLCVTSILLTNSHSLECALANKRLWLLPTSTFSWLSFRLPCKMKNNEWNIISNLTLTQCGPVKVESKLMQMFNNLYLPIAPSKWALNLCKNTSYCNYVFHFNFQLSWSSRLYHFSLYSKYSNT